jgi:3-keto-disaccharide hydrolase
MPGVQEDTFCLARGGPLSSFRSMKRYLCLLLATTAMLPLTLQTTRAEVEEGFTLLCDGKTFDGWKSSIDHPNTWKIEDGAFVTRGETAHLFYVGDLAPFTNFDLKVDVMTDPGANGGIYFHTKYQERSFPKYGFECQVDNTHSDWKKTGSLYDVVNVAKSPAEDNKWWTEEVIVKGRKITVKIDGQILLEYTEPPGAQPGDYTRKLASGTFALQAHDPKSVVRYKNIRVKRLD